MVANPSNFENSDKRPAGDENSDQLERAHELSWALLDEIITDDQMVELETLLLNDSEARESYARCVSLHADLSSHFGGSSTSANVKPSPVLGFLGSEVPPLGFDVSSAEELK